MISERSKGLISSIVSAIFLKLYITFKASSYSPNKSLAIANETQFSGFFEFA